MAIQPEIHIGAPLRLATPKMPRHLLPRRKKSYSVVIELDFDHTRFSLQSTEDEMQYLAVSIDAVLRKLNMKPRGLLAIDGRRFIGAMSRVRLNDDEAAAQLLDKLREALPNRIHVRILPGNHLTSTARS